ncbi:hypothetical protein BC832DRAFT_559320 [Gaertneriomyces semiglobifer]|nr:hypothetical protein BC832DRAFT_559320 [Gaertneriomyces semiglobifer]
MSGCANCVWDIYQSELEEYRDRKKASGQLEEGVQSIEDVDMDPGLKAFLEMEKMMSGRK